MFKKSTKKGVISIRGTVFKYEAYFSPNHHLDSTKEAIIQKYGSRLYNGQICLGITPDIVRKTINNDDYSVMVFVKNIKEEDEASGALQHWDWCNSGVKQLWIGDLCRSTTLETKPKVSPIEALLEIFSKIALSKNFRKLHLMVAEANISTLTQIYNKYGFTKTQGCPLNGYLVMDKDLVKFGGKRKTRRKNLSQV